MDAGNTHAWPSAFMLDMLYELSALPMMTKIETCGLAFFSSFRICDATQRPGYQHLDERTGTTMLFQNVSCTKGSLSPPLGNRSPPSYDTVSGTLSGRGRTSSTSASAVAVSQRHGVRNTVLFSTTTLASALYCSTEPCKSALNIRRTCLGAGRSITPGDRPTAPIEKDESLPNALV